MLYYRSPLPNHAAFFRRLFFSTTKVTSNTTAAVAFTPLRSHPTKGMSLATITLQNPVANTFTLSSLQDLGEAVSCVEAAGSNVRGLILRSGVPGFFSAGFNIPVFKGIDEKDFNGLWSLGKDIFRRIHALPVPSVAAINGHALGLGCVLSMACQYRYVVDSADKGIGLNEVAVGMPVPEWLATRFSNLTSSRTAEDILPAGTILSPNQAHQIGLVDSVFESDGEMDTAISSLLHRHTKVPQAAQAATIRYLRQPFLDHFDECFERDNRQLWTAINGQDAQQTIAAAIAQLSSRKK